MGLKIIGLILRPQLFFSF